MGLAGVVRPRLCRAALGRRIAAAARIARADARSVGSSGLSICAIAVSGLAVDILKIGLGRTAAEIAVQPRSLRFYLARLASRPLVVSIGPYRNDRCPDERLWWLWPQHLLFYILVAAIVAGSRIVVGAHYPSDVIAGALVAVLADAMDVSGCLLRWGIDLAGACRRRGCFPRSPALALPTLSRMLGRPSRPARATIRASRLPRRQGV